MRKPHYSNEDICVCLFSGKEPPKSILEASESISEPCRRTSKRSRKSTYGNSVNLNVSGTTLVYQLKMMIWETFGVVKENQILHKGSNFQSNRRGNSFSCRREYFSWRHPMGD